MCSSPHAQNSCCTELTQNSVNAVFNLKAAQYKRIMSRSALQYPEFKILAAARFLFSFAVQMQAVVMGWQIYELTKDPLYLGLIGLTEAIPAIGLALFSGSIVDRGNPLWIYRSVIGVSGLSALILFLNAGGWWASSHSTQILWIYIAAFLTGAARGFSSPAMFVMVAKVVPREVYVASSTWLALAYQSATVMGPAVGGLVFGWLNALTVYGIVFLFMTVALGLLRGMRTSFARESVPERESLKETLSGGFRVVFGNQLLTSALSLDMFAVLFGGVTALLPIFAAEILMTGPVGLGLLRSAPALGAILMGAFLIRRPITVGAGRILLGVVAGFGLCTIGFGLSRNFYFSMFLLFASGALDSVSMVVRGAIVQLCSPDSMRGRVAAVNSIFIGSSNEIGAFESGVAARLMGTVPSVIFGGTMTLLCVAMAAWKAPKLRSVDLSKL